jgi:hypothetical protein
MTFDRAGVVDEIETTELGELIETLQELTARLAVIASWASSGATGLRVVGVSMPTTAVSGTVTASGPLTNAQYVATPLAGAVHYTQRVALENMCAVLSNINNSTGA